MPSGFLLGRLDKGNGPAQLISLRELQTFISGLTTASFTAADLNFTTNHRVLGRSTAGAGPGEELTIDTILDWIGSAQGDILFRDAAGVWNVLAPSTDGFLLTTHGAAANPTWAAPGTTVNLSIKDEGVLLTATPTSIDFVGAGVAATAVGNAVTVTIAGGSSGGSMLPLVSGDLPGPSLIADASGQCIGVPL
jgi:hypothetical protein